MDKKIVRIKGRDGDEWDVPQSEVGVWLQKGYTQTPAAATAIPPPSASNPLPNPTVEAPQERSILDPLISPDDLIKNNEMARGLKKEGINLDRKTVRDLRDAPASEAEIEAVKGGRPFEDFLGLDFAGLDTPAGRRTFGAGVFDSANETLSDFTSIPSLVLGAIGGPLGQRLGKAMPTAAKYGKAALSGLGMGQGASSAASMIERNTRDTEDQPDVPDMIQQNLRDMSDIAGGGAGAVSAGQSLRNTYRKNIKAVGNPKLQEAGLAAAVGEKPGVNVRRELVRPVIDDIRMTAEKKGLTPKDFEGEDGIRLFQKVLEETSGRYEIDYLRALQPIKTMKLPTKPIVQELLAEITPEVTKNNPDYAKAIIREALRTADNIAVKSHILKIAKDFFTPAQLKVLKRTKVISRTAGELDDLRQKRNDVGKKVFAGAVSPNSAQAADMQKMAAARHSEAIRSFLYDRIAKTPGAPFSEDYIRDIKRNEGRIKELRELARTAEEHLSSSQAKYEAAGAVEPVKKSVGSAIAFGSKFVPVARGVMSAAFGAPEKTETKFLQKGFGGVNDSHPFLDFLFPDSAALGRRLGKTGAMQSAHDSSSAPAGNLPPEAAQNLEEGVETTFGNGQVWTLRNGKPQRIQ